MPTYYMFGTYTAEGVKAISAKRTTGAVDVIKGCGGQLHSMHALLGQHDVVLVADLPDAKAAMRASIALNRLTGIDFSTAEAIPVEELDRASEGAS